MAADVRFVRRALGSKECAWVFRSENPPPALDTSVGASSPIPPPSLVDSKVEAAAAAAGRGEKRIESSET